jgi:hypothetical protein
MAVVVAVLVALIVGLWVVARYAAMRHMVGIGRDGAAAQVVPLDPDLLSDVVRSVLPELEATGFHLVAASRTILGSRPQERTAHLVDAANDTIVRVMSTDGHEAAGASVAAVSWYPGGFLATSRVSSLSIQAREVLQAFPGIAPGELPLRHREGVAALASVGAQPLPLPEDLLGRLQADWRADCEAILAAGVLTRLRWAGRFARPARTATPLAGNPQLPAIAAVLGGPSPPPT